MQMTRQQRLWLLALCAATIALTICICAVQIEAKPSSKSSSSTPSSSSSSEPETPEARVIRERKELRDRKIAEKKAKKAAEAAAEKKKEEAAAKKKDEEDKRKSDTKAKKQKESDKKKDTKAETSGYSASSNDAPSKPKSELSPRRRLALEKAQKRAVELKKKRRERMKVRHQRKANRKKKEDARKKARTESLKPEIVARGAEKLKWWESQVKSLRKKSHKVVDIEYSNFKKYVHASPRPYWLFVVFTALGERYTCSICKTVKPEIEKLSQFYYLDRLRLEEEREKNGSALVVKTESDFDTPQEYDRYKRDQMPIFFVQVDIESNGEVFRLLNMQSAPTMIVMNPTAAPTPPALSALLTSLPKKNMYQLTKSDIGAVDINEFIEKVTGRTVSLSTAREPGLQGLISVFKNLLNLMDPVRKLLLTVASVMVCLLIVLYALQTVYRSFLHYQAKKALKNGITRREITASEIVPLRIYSDYSDQLLQQSVGTPSLTRSCYGVVSSGAFRKPRSLGLFRWWFIVVGCLVYLFGISGGMFNILRGHTSFDFSFLSRPRSFDIWKHIEQNDSREQTAMEGFALGILQLVLASILIFLNRVAFTERVVTTGPRTPRERAVGVARWFFELIYSPVIWMTLFYLTWKLIITIYSKKNGSYRSGFVWKHMQPHHFKFLTNYLNMVLSYLPKFVSQAILKWF